MPYVDFKEVKRLVSIEQAAHILNLPIKAEKEAFRTSCPACGDNDPRILVLTPARGLFYCFAAKTGGDCIALVQHITGLSVAEAAEMIMPHTREEAHSAPSPTKQKVEKKSTPFNPTEFAAKLVYSDEVKALGFSEEDAERFSVGFYRGKIYLPMRDATGFIAGFIGYSSEGLKLPPQWLAAPSNVVALRRGA